MTTPYTATYIKEGEGLPAPTGKFGLEIQASKTNSDQRFEANKLLEFIEAQGTEHYGGLATTSTPTPLLIKVPGTHMVRFLTGIAPYIKDPFAQKESNLTGHFLAIMQDIDTVAEDADIIRLPNDILKVAYVIAPTAAQFKTKINLGEETPSGTMWFQQNPVKENTVEVAKVAPLPPYLAYDALTTDVPAHVIWERIQLADSEGMEEVFEYAQNFLMAAHVNHNVSNANNLQIDSQFFMERQSSEARTWGRLRTTNVYPMTTSEKTNSMATTTNQPNQAITALSQILGQHGTTAGNQAGTPTQSTPSTLDANENNFKKYGMSEGDLARALQMCGLLPGQEDHLPTWFHDIAEKNLSADGKRSIIKILFNGNIPYEEHEIPSTPTVLDLAIKKNWIGDGDGATATGVMKGLSPYLFSAITAEEVEIETNFADAVRSSTSATVSDIQKLKQEKATPPASHQVLVATLKTFANALERLFTGRGPLYMVLRANIITSLTKINKQAKSLISKTTLASIMWGCYKQAQHYAMGLMTGPNALVAEWQIMSQNILGGAQDFKFLEVPLAISGNELEPTPTPKKPIIPSITPGRNDLAPPERDPITPKRRKITNVKIHPAIKAKVTALLPDRLNIKKLTTACNLTSARMIFPNSDICVPTALTGKCPYTTCRNNHDPAKITDVIAEEAISVLDPFIRNPLALNEGQ